ncbi:hypothetical protein BU24DRAFT_468697 [Aaosphaeria arxii CBS 175.79]|uniref:Uncharacterized protein n=1 Tax=Aaosphaeria arxii CBS 175.79 TaxID=1450172 RepID=A0A6A5X6V6_9PLEO|nr:uncharacterized protein BU24DRAFT_468697 [Aaosphaeria arxii CBS 175.79]KAF2008577.1 hypothetical protein BU24DRAFT_468697 [Aaosphaeria arxii CBS 175.79]
MQSIEYEALLSLSHESENLDSTDSTAQLFSILPYLFNNNIEGMEGVECIFSRSPEDAREPKGRIPYVEKHAGQPMRRRFRPELESEMGIERSRGSKLTLYDSDYLENTSLSQYPVSSIEVVSEEYVSGMSWSQKKNCTSDPTCKETFRDLRRRGLNDRGARDRLSSCSPTFSGHPRTENSPSPNAGQEMTSKSLRKKPKFVIARELYSQREARADTPHISETTPYDHTDGCPEACDYEDCQTLEPSSRPSSTSEPGGNRI